MGFILNQEEWFIASILIIFIDDNGYVRLEVQPNHDPQFLIICAHLRHNDTGSLLELITNGQEFYHTEYDEHRKQGEIINGDALTSVHRSAIQAKIKEWLQTALEEEEGDHAGGSIA